MVVVDLERTTEAMLRQMTCTYNREETYFL